VVNLCAKTLHFTGFRAFWISLQTPKIGNFGVNFPKVSKPIRGNSRFEETLGGDKFRSHCPVGLAGESALSILD